MTLRLKLTLDSDQRRYLVPRNFSFFLRSHGFAVKPSELQIFGQTKVIAFISDESTGRQPDPWITFACSQCRQRRISCHKLIRGPNNTSVAQTCIWVLLSHHSTLRPVRFNRSKHRKQSEGHDAKSRCPMEPTVSAWWRISSFSSTYVRQDGSRIVLSTSIR